MNLILGMDIGTTKTAAVLFDTDTLHCAACPGIVHPADAGSGRQSPARHLAAVREAVSALPADLRRAVCGIGVSTQMHGVLCWNTIPGENSPLYTWQSHTDDLEVLRKLPGCGRLRHGFGGASLGMLARTGDLKKWTRCGTIGDYAVCHLTGRNEVVMDRTNAAGWGLMDFDADKVDEDDLQKVIRRIEKDEEVELDELQKDAVISAESCLMRRKSLPLKITQKFFLMFLP